MQHADENGSLYFPKFTAFNFQKAPRASNEGKNPFPAPTRPSQASLVTPRAPKSPCCCVQTFSGTHHRRRVCGGDTRHFPSSSIWACFQSIRTHIRQGVCSASHFQAEYFSMHGGPTAIITFLCEAASP
jgi:hypothetical protein